MLARDLDETLERGERARRTELTGRSGRRARGPARDFGEPNLKNAVAAARRDLHLPRLSDLDLGDRLDQRRSVSARHATPRHIEHSFLELDYELADLDLLSREEREVKRRVELSMHVPSNRLELARQALAPRPSDPLALTLLAGDLDGLPELDCDVDVRRARVVEPRTRRDHRPRIRRER
ncbi:MAG: hypothetical protein RIB77_33905 [Sandaracinaceae bacterium]